MPNFASSGFSSGGLVVASGGGNPLTKKVPLNVPVWGFFVAFLLLILVIVIVHVASKCSDPVGLVKEAVAETFSGVMTSRLAHASARSDGGYGIPSSELYPDRAQRTSGFDGKRRDMVALDSMSGFLGSRETPHFQDVPNHVIQVEDRQRAAIRALGKINQERTRRGTEPPLPWEPFWREWQSSHPVAGEYGFSEGFSGKRNGEFELPSVY